MVVCLSTGTGKYGASESLLHLLVRCKLEGAVGVLLQHRNRGSKGAILQQRDYKGRTPSEIARKKGSKRTAEMLAMASVSFLLGVWIVIQVPASSMKLTPNIDKGHPHTFLIHHRAFFQYNTMSCCIKHTSLRKRLAIFLLTTTMLL